MFNSVTGFDLGVTTGILVGVRSALKVRTLNCKVRVKGLSLVLVFRVFCAWTMGQKNLYKYRKWKRLCVQSHHMTKHSLYKLKDRHDCTNTQFYQVIVPLPAIRTPPLPLSKYDSVSLHSEPHSSDMPPQTAKSYRRGVLKQRHWSVFSSNSSVELNPTECVCEQTSDKKLHWILAQRAGWLCSPDCKRIFRKRTGPRSDTTKTQQQAR